MNCRNQIEKMSEEANIKYDGLDNWYTTIKTQFKRLNIDHQETHFAWAEASKQANRQLREENQKLKKNDNINDDKKENDHFVFREDGLNFTMRDAMQTLKQTTVLINNMTSTNKAKSRKQLALNSRLMKSRLTSKSKLKPTQKPIYKPYVQLDSVSEADCEDENEALQLKTSKNGDVIVTYHLMQKNMGKLYVEYLKLSPQKFERPVLMIVMEGMNMRKIQRSVYSKYLYAKQITKSVENVMQILATGVFDLLPEIDEAAYRKQWK
eukprot:191884_1